MNREITTKRVKGKGVVFMNPCPESIGKETETFVGDRRYCNEKCPYFRKFTVNKEGKQVVHCESPFKK